MDSWGKNSAAVVPRVSGPVPRILSGLEPRYDCGNDVEYRQLAQLPVELSGGHFECRGQKNLLNSAKIIKMH